MEHTTPYHDRQLIQRQNEPRPIQQILSANVSSGSNLPAKPKVAMKSAEV
jgi:hypothetical protein